VLVLAALLAVGCAGAPLGPPVAPWRGLREMGLRAPDDPTVRGVRLVPLSLDEAHGWGVEPGGGLRAIVAGVRVVSFADGAIVAATDRLPATPTGVTAVPDRMGGGFLYALGTHLWRTDSWLGPPSPILTAPAPIAQVLVGLDRVYVRSQGTLVAIDARTGARTDLGPLPASPNVGRLAALDAWHAVTVADLRGALVTLDAGSTWRPLALPIEPAEVVALDDSIAVGGPDVGRQTEWWEVRPDGQTGRLSGAPASASPPEHRQNAMDAAARTFGARPLVAAIEDGWPLADGTALVARDGALGRVRLADGALVESAPGSFALDPARCHPLSLARAHDPGAFGFVCGEPRGRTIVYRWDPPSGQLVELRRFPNPREVLAFGNGALAARGPCAETSDEARRGEQAWCVMSAAASSDWSEIHFRGDDVDRARLVVLSDDRMALVRPPTGGELSTARLTITDGVHSSHLPIALPASLRPDVATVLRAGVWLDGFEERRTAHGVVVVGGWVDVGGSVVGLEIGLDGQARLGEYIRDAGAPVVSGRWAFGWTASRSGFETTDGGMTWTKEIDLPDPIAPGRVIKERACGPVGCMAAGWLRVGWGPAEPSRLPEPPLREPWMTSHSAPALDLDCDPLSGRPPDSKPSPPARAPPRAQALPSLSPRAPWNLFAGSTFGTVSELPRCAGRAAPTMPTGDVGVTAEASNAMDKTLRGAPLACIYAWGPKTGDWDTLGRWQVLWGWPWGGWSDARSSAPAPSPWTSLDAARRALGKAPGIPAGWALAPGDDADHALLMTHHAPGPGGAAGVDLVVLDADREPVDVRRPGGDPFPEVEGAARVSGRWYLATMQAPGELAATVVWQLDGSIAREVARVRRGGFEVRPSLRLARRSDGRSLGLVVDGQPEGGRGPQSRWVVAIDLESGGVGEPEALAPVDSSDRAISLCTGDDAGWQLEVPYPGAVRLRVGAWESALQSAVARMRLSREKACVERVLGAIEANAGTAPQALTKGASGVGSHWRGDARTLDASVFSARARYALRCTLRK